jgi:hypothetical protein
MDPDVKSFKATKPPTLSQEIQMPSKIKTFGTLTAGDRLALQQAGNVDKAREIGRERSKASRNRVKLGESIL